MSGAELVTTLSWNCNVFAVIMLIQFEIWGCPADLLINQTVQDRSPQPHGPHLEGAPGCNRTHNTTSCRLLLYKLDQQSAMYVCQMY